MAQSIGVGIVKQDIEDIEEVGRGQNTEASIGHARSWDFSLNLK